MLDGVVNPMNTSRGRELVTRVKAHQLITIGESPDRYIKQFETKEPLEREWAALQECRGSQIQKVLDVDWSNLQLTLEFDQHAIPLSDFNPQDVALFTSLLSHVIQSIKHCHKNGWVHGDIKPSNILYVPNLRTIRLIDFGVSHRIGTSREALTDWQATPMFASPNQLSGEGLVDTGDDWFPLLQIIDQVMSVARDNSIRSTLFTWRDALSIEV